MYNFFVIIAPLFSDNSQSYEQNLKRAKEIEQQLSRETAALVDRNKMRIQERNETTNDSKCKCCIIS